MSNAFDSPFCASGFLVSFAAAGQSHGQGPDSAAGGQTAHRTHIRGGLPGLQLRIQAEQIGTAGIT